MNVDVKKEKILLNQLVLKRTESYQIEQDIIIPDIKPDILNSITAKGIVCINKKEAQNGCVLVVGSVNIYLVYLADDDKNCIRSITSTIDFSKKISVQEAKEGMDICLKNCIKNIECKVINGRKVNIKINMCTDLKLYSNNNIELVKEIENIKEIQSLNKDININCLIGQGDVKTFAKETISVDSSEEIQEIMQVDLSIINKDVKVSYNKILIKAEVNFKILYLNNKNQLKKINSIVPIMGFVDMQDISENDIVDLNFYLKNTIIKLNPQEEHSVYVEAEIEIQAFIYTSKKFNYIEDMYSPSRNLEFDKRELEIDLGNNIYQKEFNFKETTKFSGIRGDIYDYDISARILKTSKTSDKVVYDGELETRLLVQGENNIDLKNVVIPFNYSVERNGKGSNEIETEIELRNEEVKMLQDDLLEVNVDMNFEVREKSLEKINIMNNIKLEENRSGELYSLVIYYVQEGDTLWKIAKNFGSTVNDIVDINNLDDSNKIEIGQKLFIPKYIEYINVSD